MSSKPHTDDVYRPKRIPKNPIKFKIQLNDEQKHDIQKLGTIIKQVDDNLINIKDMLK